MANKRKIDSTDELGYYLYGVLKLPRNDTTIKTILDLIEGSGTNSTGILAVRNLMEYVLGLKMDKLKKEIREVLERK
jgi:hypothetical protein